MCAPTGGATPCTHKHTHTRADTQMQDICLWACMQRSASTRTHTHGFTLRDMKAHVPMHHSGVHMLTHTQERALSGGSGRGWAHRAPIRWQEAPLTPLMEGRVWRKVLPEMAWRRHWHWSAPGHSWPSCRCPEFPRQAGVTLGPGSPQAGRPVWQTPFLSAGLRRVLSGLPSQTRRRASRLWPVPVLDTVSHSSCQLWTPHHSFPCSLVSSPAHCWVHISLVSSPAHWLGLVLLAHWLVPPGTGLPPGPPSSPLTWHMASSTCPQLLLASHPRHGPYCMCQAWRSATHLIPNTPSTIVLESRPTRPMDTSPDPAASEWGLSLAPETGEGPGTLAWSHYQAFTGGGGGLAEKA